MTSVFQSLLLVIAGATQKELARQVQYLKVENQILRSRMPKRIIVTPKERTRLVNFSQMLGRAGMIRRNVLHAGRPSPNTAKIAGLIRFNQSDSSFTPAIAARPNLGTERLTDWRKNA